MQIWITGPIISSPYLEPKLYFIFMCLKSHGYRYDVHVHPLLVIFFFILCPFCPRSVGGFASTFRGSHYFLESLHTPDRWLAQRWRPVTSGNWTPNIYIPSGARVAQLYPQTLGADFSRLLRHAWATLGLFFTPGHHTGALFVIIRIVKM
jgi:hypothetical protein